MACAKLSLFDVLSEFSSKGLSQVGRFLMAQLLDVETDEVLSWGDYLPYSQLPNLLSSGNKSSPCREVATYVEMNWCCIQSGASIRFSGLF